MEFLDDSDLAGVTGGIGLARSITSPSNDVHGLVYDPSHPAAISHAIVQGDNTHAPAHGAEHKDEDPFYGPGAVDTHPAHEAPPAPRPSGTVDHPASNTHPAPDPGHGLIPANDNAPRSPLSGEGINRNLAYLGAREAGMDRAKSLEVVQSFSKDSPIVDTHVHDTWRSTSYVQDPARPGIYHSPVQIPADTPIKEHLALPRGPDPTQEGHYQSTSEHGTRALVGQVGPQPESHVFPPGAHGGGQQAVLLEDKQRLVDQHAKDYARSANSEPVHSAGQDFSHGLKDGVRSAFDPTLGLRDIPGQVREVLHPRQTLEQFQSTVREHGVHGTASRVGGSIAGALVGSEVIKHGTDYVDRHLDSVVGKETAKHVRDAGAIAGEYLKESAPIANATSDFLQRHTPISKEWAERLGLATDVGARFVPVAGQAYSVGSALWGAYKAAEKARERLGSTDKPPPPPEAPHAPPPAHDPPPPPPPPPPPQPNTHQAPPTPNALPQPPSAQQPPSPRDALPQSPSPPPPANALPTPPPEEPPPANAAPTPPPEAQAPATPPEGPPPPPEVPPPPPEVPPPPPVVEAPPPSPAPNPADDPNALTPALPQPPETPPPESPPPIQTSPEAPPSPVNDPNALTPAAPAPETITPVAPPDALISQADTPVQEQQVASDYGGDGGGDFA